MIRSYRLAQAFAFVVALAVAGCGGEAAKPAASSGPATAPGGAGPDPVKNLPAAAKPADAPKVEAAKPAEAPKDDVKAAAPKLESPK